MSKKHVLVTGGEGFLGRYVVQRLQSNDAYQIFAPERSLYDLRKQIDVERMFCEVEPDIVIHLAATVGGIGKNRAYPGQLFYDNAIMGIIIMECARQHHIQKCINVGTVCSYPSNTSVPFSEDTFWDGYPEVTNAPYGIAKKMLLTQALAYQEEYGFNSSYLILTNLYGPGDKIDPESSHVVPSLVRKFSSAVEEQKSIVTLWGDGTPTRELLYVDDAARAIVNAVEKNIDCTPINIGSGTEVSIANLATIIAKKVGYTGKILWDTSYPNGQMKRRIDSSAAKDLLDFEAQVSLDDGLRNTINWYELQKKSISAVVL